MEKSSTVLHDHEGHVETTVVLVADSAPYAEALKECYEKLKADHRASVDLSFQNGELKLVYTIESLAHYEKRRLALVDEHARAIVASTADAAKARIREVVEDIHDDLEEFKQSAAEHIMGHVSETHKGEVARKVEELKAQAAAAEQDNADEDAAVLKHLGGDQAKFDALTEPEFQAIVDELKAGSAAPAQGEAALSAEDLDKELAKTGESTKVQ